MGLLKAFTGLVFAGFALGTGFWLSKKMTGRIDEWLASRDPDIRKAAEVLRDHLKAQQAAEAAKEDK